MNRYELKSEPLTIAFFQVGLTTKEEQDDSVAQAAHRRPSQGAVQGILPRIAGESGGSGNAGHLETRFFTVQDACVRSPLASVRPPNQAQIHSAHHQLNTAALCVYRFGPPTGHADHRSALRLGNTIRSLPCSAWIGHPYFGEDGTFLLWADTNVSSSIPR